MGPQPSAPSPQFLIGTVKKIMQKKKKIDLFCSAFYYWQNVIIYISQNQHVKMWRNVYHLHWNYSGAYFFLLRVFFSDLILSDRKNLYGKEAYKYLSEKGYMRKTKKNKTFKRQQGQTCIFSLLSLKMKSFPSVIKIWKESDIWLGRPTTELRNSPLFVSGYLFIITHSICLRTEKGIIFLIILKLTNLRLNSSIVVAR